jgi:decaprenylphospho-beta-D-ribofuranose 2-oxidase
VTGGTADPLPGIPGTDEEVGCYSRLYRSRANVRTPSNIEDLRRIFAHARENNRRVTLRAGAHSFDGQAIGDDLVVSMKAFDSIEVLPDNRVRVGAGAKWGAILAELKPRGLVPAVTVTTEDATAGGTLSGDCLSRFSPAWGKEGRFIESFDLLTTDGELIHCTPPDENADRSTWTREQRAFLGTVGGLGWLGAVVEITYRVLPVRSMDDESVRGQIGVHTIVRKFETFRDLARYLVPAAKKMYLEDSDPRDPTKLDAIWSALSTRGPGSEQALFFTSEFTLDPKRRRMDLHRPYLLRRILVEWLMRVPWISRLMWRFYFRFMFKDPKEGEVGDEFFDDLEGYSFFMDGNARAKRIGSHLGFSMRNCQQTFVVPSDPGAAGGWDQARDDLVEWLEHAHNRLSERGLTPTLNDALFLPEDGPFPLSASVDQPGFAVSYAFETSNRGRLERVQDAFRELADDLWEKFGGRVYLVKNVFARPETLAKMYGDHAVKFFAWKAEFDPDCVLRDAFLDRTFGDLCDSAYARASAG